MALMRWCAVALLLLASGARAQQVLTDGEQVQMHAFADVFSSGCVQNQKPNIWKQLGVNPLTCHPQTMPQDSAKQCTLKGASLVAHQGTMCYYCVPQVPPGTIYIADDQVERASQQGYSCGDSPVDPGCMAVCWPESKSTTTYIPPPVQPTTGGGGPLTATATTDPCHPNYDLSTAAGRTAMQANAARDAAACNESRCKHNPQLDVCKNGTPKPPAAAATAPCVVPTWMNPYAWPTAQAQGLKSDLAAAKAMLQKAQAKVNQWDPPTAALAKKYFGSDSSSVQGIMKLNIASGIAMTGTLSQINTIFHPDPVPLAQYGNDAPTATTSMWDNADPRIFLTSLYWKLPSTGPDSRAAVLVHEISHTPQVADTADYAYGQNQCQLLVAQATSPFNQLLKTLGVNVVAPTTPISNAASFQYFIYYASQLK